MLSDEEKKAIDKLKRSANYFVMPIYETKIILELIEKQSKEIEELHKEINQRIKLKLENERCADEDFIHKDKIKAKIDEINKEYFEKIAKLTSLMEQTILTHQRYSMENVLKSLLEKE